MRPAVSARTVAFDVLRAVHVDDAYANLLLPPALARAGLSGPDAALATELTYGTLRRQGTWDAVISLAAGRDLTLIDPAVLDILRLSTHQLLATRVPPHAAVNEAVELSRATGNARASGFVNAVLRSVSSASESEWIDRAEQSARSDDEALAVRTAHPVWVIRALRRALDAEGRVNELAALLAADNDAPGVTLVALPGLADRPVDAEKTPFSPYGFRSGGGDPTQLTTQTGVRVQDEGSQLAALALVHAAAPVAGERWLDLCAGPGGKTAVLAASAVSATAAGTPITLEANEVSPTRAGLVRRSVAGIPLSVEVSERDGRERPGNAAYDRILVDAPCTGLGALRRRPEARWRKSPADVPELAALQRELLTAAIAGLRAGGIVAYVTCSPHLAETRDVVAEVRADSGDAVEELNARDVVRSLASSRPDLAEPRDGSGRAQLWPHRHGTDAMSISLLRKL